MASTKTLSKALSAAALALSLTGIAHAQENTEAIQAEPAASAPAATPATPAASAPASAQKVETESAKPKCGLSLRSVLGAFIASGLDKSTRSAGAGDMAQIIISPGCSRKLEP